MLISCSDELDLYLELNCRQPKKKQVRKLLCNNCWTKWYVNGFLSETHMSSFGLNAQQVVPSQGGQTGWDYELEVKSMIIHDEAGIQIRYPPSLYFANTE